MEGHDPYNVTGTWLLTECHLSISLPSRQRHDAHWADKLADWVDFFQLNFAFQGAAGLGNTPGLDFSPEDKGVFNFVKTHITKVEHVEGRQDPIVHFKGFPRP